MHEVEHELAVERGRLILVAREASQHEIVRLEVNLERLVVAGLRHGGAGGGVGAFRPAGAVPLVSIEF